MTETITKPIIKPGYKKTPVGIIPEDWEVKRINVLLEESYLGGNYDNTKESNIGEKTPLIKMGNIGRGLIQLDNCYTIDRDEDLDKKHLLKYNDILFNTRNTLDLVGKVAIWKNEYRKAYFNSNLLKLVFKESEISSSDFINYQLNSHLALRKLRGVATGTTSVAAIYDKDIKKIQLPIPPLPEQERIAACLTTWDTAIEKLSQLIAAKKQQKKGLMQGLFNGQLSIENGQLIQAREGEDFTEDWEEVRLGKLFKERNERGFDDLKLLSIGEEGVYPQSLSNKKDTSNSNKSKYKLIESGDIGYNTMRLWQGRIALSNIRGIVSPAYTIIKPQLKYAHPKFFYYFFKFPYVVNKFYQNSQGMVSDTLTCRYNDFKRIKLKVPSLQKQTVIAQILSIADGEIEVLKQKKAAFQTQKKGLMQVLLTGEKRLMES